ncbi:MAG: hypothetical protein SGPRY_006606, partial [Prymnesium sp.]
DYEGIKERAEKLLSSRKRRNSRCPGQPRQSHPVTVPIESYSTRANPPPQPVVKPVPPVVEKQRLYNGPRLVKGNQVRLERLEAMHGKTMAKLPSGPKKTLRFADAPVVL